MSKKSRDQILKDEQDFHDDWAESEDIMSINIMRRNTALTAPEMRFIKDKLGNINGKTLLDVGCGLGEASVFFALLGADVTASDLSPGMLKVANDLAAKNNVSIKNHLASADDLHLDESMKYDIIYAGNLLHHVEIDETLGRFKNHLSEDGVLVTWDPLAYNPIINVYRMIATDVRTPDEHPLKMRDIKLFKKHFARVETNYFWLTTLAIFILMAVFQRRNPNSERYWKSVVDESDKWEWLYKPLALLDKILYKLLPFLKPLSWNIVVFSYKKNI